MKKSSSEIGTIYGVGLGPGSVDLMSVRADKLIKSFHKGITTIKW